MHRQELLTFLKQHQTRFMEEAGYLSRAISIVETQPDCFDRELWPAHVTGSAWVVSPDCNRVLLMHHKKHGQWFQPGGHADGDADILRVALRETVEETGLESSQVKLLGKDVFDVDIHTIPAIGDEPQHEHIDVRFLVEIDDSLAVPGNDESHQIRWVSLHEITRYNNNRSSYRMMEKTRQLRNRLAA
ncbi:MAG: NUDIX hydrolase [Gammaproteobacteria bacterium]